MSELRQRLHGISLRARITIWYAGMLLLTLAVFSTGIRIGLQQYLKQSMQQELSSDAHSVVSDYLSHIGTKGRTWALGEIREAYPPTDNDPFIRLSSDSGVLLEPQLPNEGISPLTRIPLATTTVPEGAFHRYKVDQDTVMVYSLPYTAPDGSHFEVETGQSMAVSTAAIHNLNKMLLTAAPLLLMLGTFGGYLLMRRPLRPLRLLTEEAENIGRRELGDRLPVIPTADELERLTHSLNRMIGRMEEALSHNQRFSADASHELRTPLTIMRGEMEEMLLLPDLPQQAVENLVSTLDEIDRMSRIVSSLMTITRLDAGGERMAMEPVNLTALARSTIDQMRLLAIEKGFPLTLQADRDIWIFADPMRLKQILVNLVDNAIKYTPQNDLLSMDDDFESVAVPLDTDNSKGVCASVHISGKMAVLEITDHGIGIPAASLPHIFDRFYRADYARNRIAGGVGLGLSIVKSIVVAHDGKVSASSEEGVFTTMRVQMPLLPREKIPAPQPAAETSSF